MKRTLTVLLSSALVLAAPAGVVAAKGKGHSKSHSRAKVFKASIGPVGTDAAYAGIHGKAQLVDNKKRDKISIHMRGLKAGTTYPWHIHEFAAGVTNPCTQGAAQGPIVTAFTYRRLKANSAGNANSTGRSKTFTADKTKKYYVNVHDPASGAPIACGVLKAPKAKKAPKSKKKSSSRARGKGRS